MNPRKETEPRSTELEELGEGHLYCPARSRCGDAGNTKPQIPSVSLRLQIRAEFDSELDAGNETVSDIELQPSATAAGAAENDGGESPEEAPCVDKATLGIAQSVYRLPVLTLCHWVTENSSLGTRAKLVVTDMQYLEHVALSPAKSTERLRFQSIAVICPLWTSNLMVD